MAGLLKIKWPGQATPPSVSPAPVKVPDQQPVLYTGPDAKQFGMENFGNTCYANSVLQALYFCQPFRDLVCSAPDRHQDVAPAVQSREAPAAPPPSNTRIPATPGGTPNTNTPKSPDAAAALADAASATPAIPLPPTLFSALRTLYMHISTHTSEKGIVSPTSFIAKLKRENELFRSTMHQDAHEFLNYLLNKILEDLEGEMRDAKDNTPSEDLSKSITSLEDSTQVSTASHPTYAGFSARPTLVQNLFEGVLTNETRCLTCETVSSRDESFLDLSIDIEQNSSVTSCLRQFSASEMLSGKNKFFCDSCCSLQEAEKRMKIKTLPNILALHLKRFKLQPDEDKYVKLAYRVAFPLELRLFNTVDESENPDRLYNLFAIVVHIGGGPHQGHYITIVKSHGGIWRVFDDTNVYSIAETDIPKYFGDAPAGAGYVLFYQAADLDAGALGLKKPVLPTPSPEDAPPIAESVGTSSGADISTPITTGSRAPSETSSSIFGLALSPPMLSTSSLEDTPPTPAIQPPAPIKSPALPLLNPTGPSPSSTPSASPIIPILHAPWKSGPKADKDKGHGLSPSPSTSGGHLLSTSYSSENEKRLSWFPRGKRKDSLTSSSPTPVPPSPGLSSKISMLRLPSRRPQSSAGSHTQNRLSTASSIASPASALPPSTFTNETLPHEPQTTMTRPRTAPTSHPFGHQTNGFRPHVGVPPVPPLPAGIEPSPILTTFPLPHPSAPSSPVKTNLPMRKSSLPHAPPSSYSTSSPPLSQSAFASANNSLASSSPPSSPAPPRPPRRVTSALSSSSKAQHPPPSPSAIAFRSVNAPRPQSMFANVSMNGSDGLGLTTESSVFSTSSPAPPIPPRRAGRLSVSVSSKETNQSEERDKKNKEKDKEAKLAKRASRKMSLTGGLFSWALRGGDKDKDKDKEREREPLNGLKEVSAPSRRASLHSRSLSTSNGNGKNHAVH